MAAVSWSSANYADYEDGTLFSVCRYLEVSSCSSDDAAGATAAEVRWRGHCFLLILMIKMESTCLLWKLIQRKVDGGCGTKEKPGNCLSLFSSSFATVAKKKKKKKKVRLKVDMVNYNLF